MRTGKNGSERGKRREPEIPEMIRFSVVTSDLSTSLVLVSLENYSRRDVLERSDSKLRKSDFANLTLFLSDPYRFHLLYHLQHSS